MHEVTKTSLTYNSKTKTTLLLGILAKIPRIRGSEKNKIKYLENNTSRKINTHITTQKIYVIRQHAYIHQRLQEESFTIIGRLQCLA